MFFSRSSAKALSLEQKLEVLARCGLALADPFTVDDLLESWPRREFEKPGFDLALVGLAMTEEKPPWRNHCLNAWHFDAECIEDHGAYARIAERMRDLAGGSLPIEDIRDSVNIDGDAWLEFTYDGRLHHIPCVVDDDWVDTNVFTHFVEILSSSDPAKVFLFYDLHGQDCVIACVTRDQFAELQRAGIGFRPLDASI